jgi:hypothetical protein
MIDLLGFSQAFSVVEVLAPVLGDVGKIIFKRFIPFFDIKPKTEEQLAREFSNDVKVKTRTDFNDANHVIKCSEAIKCVEKHFSETTLIWEFVKTAVKDLIAGETVKKPSEDLANRIAECIRENCLRSDTPRVLIEKKFYHRPARGHGKGRTSFG